MPKFESLTHVFKHPWKDISVASWQKYPCDSRPDVLSVDFLSRDYDPTTGIFKSRRLMINKSQMPGWLASIVRSDGVFFFVEDSTVDPKNKVMTLVGKNLSFNNIMEMRESCTYTVCPENENWTHFKQDVTVEAFPFGIARKMEDYSLQKFQENAIKGRQIMEQAIMRLKKQTEASLISQSN